MRTHQKIISTLAIETAEGSFAAHYSSDGLAQLDFPDRAKKIKSRANVPDIRHWHKLAEGAVTRVLAGRDAGTLPPLDLGGATPFQAKVWAVLPKIRTSKTQSYGQVAASIGAPKAARAVGSACGANPIPLLIPCHRVLASGGGLGGFSGGLHWKRKLLEIENAKSTGK